MAKSLLDTLLDSIFDEEWKGKYGERLTEGELKLVQLLGRKGKILHNIYLPKENGETSEVDVIFITQKGIFVFESKNYSGWIFGDEKSRNWTVMLPNKQKNQFYNPILQNRTHIKWMSNFVGVGVPLYSIIVFSNRCELKKITVFSEDVKVIKRERTYATVREIWERRPDVLSDDQIEDLYSKLKELTKVDKTVKQAHVQNIEKKYKTAPVSLPQTSPYNGMAISTPIQANVNTMICPKCGSKMVLRTAQKGQNAGRQFYGCSAFPKCRYIVNI